MNEVQARSRQIEDIEESVVNDVEDIKLDEYLNVEAIE